MRERLALRAIEFGASPRRAIPVACLAEEYEWLACCFPGCRVIGQRAAITPRWALDEIAILDATGQQRRVYFDIEEVLCRYLARLGRSKLPAPAPDNFRK